jgi:uncharacterized protein (DUF2147 family)
MINWRKKHLDGEIMLPSDVVNSKQIFNLKAVDDNKYGFKGVEIYHLKSGKTFSVPLDMKVVNT